MTSREGMSADRSAAGTTTHVHTDGLAEPLSCGEYLDAVMTQLCVGKELDVTADRVSEEQAPVSVRNAIPMVAVSQTSGFNNAETL